MLGCLEARHNLENQVLALKGLFLLLQNHDLDCPKYYEKLYALLLPQRVKLGAAAKTISLFQMDSDTKTRFLRLLDLSLRASTLPSKLVAAFLKRLGRVMVSHGQVQTASDAMFVVGLTANLVKRHPRCHKLIHRKHTSISLGKRLTMDPYDATETDPLKAKAMKSSLWELEIVMQQHYDQRVRDFAKVLKTDIGAKKDFIKAQDYAQADNLALLKADLDELDFSKEAALIRKNLMARHG